MTGTPVDRVVSALRAGSVAADVRRFDEPVPTAAAAAEALGCEVGAIANSLVFDADGAPLLVLASGAHRVDTARSPRCVGARRVRRASPEFVLAATGQEVGGVAPVGHPAPLRTVVDVDLAAYAVCGPAAATTTRCSPRPTRICCASPPARPLPSPERRVRRVTGQTTTWAAGTIRPRGSNSCIAGSPGGTCPPDSRASAGPTDLGVEAVAQLLGLPDLGDLEAVARLAAHVHEQAVDAARRAAGDLGVQGVVELDRRRHVHHVSVGHGGLRSGWKPGPVDPDGSPR